VENRSGEIKTERGEERWGSGGGLFGRPAEDETSSVGSSEVGGLSIFPKGVGKGRGGGKRGGVAVDSRDNHAGATKVLKRPEKIQ